MDTYTLYTLARLTLRTHLDSAATARANGQAARYTDSMCVADRALNRVAYYGVILADSKSNRIKIQRMARQAKYRA